MNFFKQPGHVFAEGLHGVEGLGVAGDFADIPPIAEIPIAGADDDHLADGEKEIDGAKDMRGAAAPGRHDGRADLALEHLVVGLGDHAGTLDQRL